MTSRTRVRKDFLAPWPTRAMLGLLDRDPDTLSKGDPLPLGWHWLYFRESLRASHLGPDGHERRGTFMPDVDLPGRMWAGGMLRTLRPARLGERAELRSGIGNVTQKRGRSGRLVFVTVGHTLMQGGRPCVEEEQVIVYREARRHVADRPARPKPLSPPPTGPARDRADLPAGQWARIFLPTTVTLFQFSALTYNSHRIHYDHPYATEHEGYAGLLVHGPFTALLLLDAARRENAAPVSSFRYRALAPLYADRPITLAGRPGSARAADAGHTSETSRPGKQVVEALDPDGMVAMRGWVR